jgi:hypothetical protein
MQLTRLHRLSLGYLAATCLLVCTTAASFADAWPSRSIKLIVPFPAGGAADTVARVYADNRGSCRRKRISRLVHPAHEITLPMRIPRPDAFGRTRGITGFSSRATESHRVGADARFRRDEIRDRWLLAVVDSVYRPHESFFPF